MECFSRRHADETRFGQAAYADPRTEQRAGVNVGIQLRRGQSIARAGDIQRVEIGAAEVTMEQKSTVEVGKADARSLLGLLDQLEDQEDVNDVHANFDIPEEVLAEAMA